MSPEEEKIELLAYMQVIINYLDVKEELISSEDKIYNLLSEAIKKHNKVSFCIIEQDNIIPEKYTTYFKSVIVFGTVHILENESEKRTAIEILAEKYSPHQKEGRLKEIDRELKQLCMIELNIEHISGKQAIELAKQNTQ